MARNRWSVIPWDVVLETAVLVARLECCGLSVVLKARPRVFSTSINNLLAIPIWELYNSLVVVVLQRSYNYSCLLWAMRICFMFYLSVSVMVLTTRQTIPRHAKFIFVGPTGPKKLYFQNEFWEYSRPRTDLSIERFRQIFRVYGRYCASVDSWPLAYICWLWR